VRVRCLALDRKPPGPLDPESRALVMTKGACTFLKYLCVHISGLLYRQRTIFGRRGPGTGG